MILLQAELGAGSRAPTQLTNALAELKTKMKSALKKGDQFVISLSADNATSFHLNGIELLQLKDATIFQFFLAGWVGESSSALMREKLLADRVAAPVLARFEALQPNTERVALVTAWMAPLAVPESSPAATIPKPALVKKAVAKTKVETKAEAKVEAAPKIKSEPEAKTVVAAVADPSPTAVETSLVPVRRECRPA